MAYYDMGLSVFAYSHVTLKSFNRQPTWLTQSTPNNRPMFEPWSDRMPMLIFTVFLTISLHTMGPKVGPSWVRTEGRDIDRAEVQILPSAVLFFD